LGATKRIVDTLKHKLVLLKSNINTLSNLISPENIILRLHGKTKKAVINELLDILAVCGKLLDRDTALKDLLGIVMK
jgi:hypothetical protein